MMQAVMISRALSTLGLHTPAAPGASLTHRQRATKQSHTASADLLHTAALVCNPLLVLFKVRSHPHLPAEERRDVPYHRPNSTPELLGVERARELYETAWPQQLFKISTQEVVVCLSWKYHPSFDLVLCVRLVLFNDLPEGSCEYCQNRSWR